MNLLGLVVLCVVLWGTLMFSILAVSVGLKLRRVHPGIICALALFRFGLEALVLSGHVRHYGVLLVLYTAIVFYLVAKGGGGPRPRKRKPLRDTREHHHLPSIFCPPLPA
jgi:hypothetical protein